ncbi:sensor histidine kinase [Rhodococcoides fascians]|uniref:sensor histidine kinase n=1 Tax=Rhodococcoides fascians TaxID=1828 RepID=UPI00068D98C0|nr:GAF domain-containing sensor histidine kinase [Rhodococcus fascians]
MTFGDGTVSIVEHGDMVVDAMTIGIAVVDARGVIAELNKAGVRVLGFSDRSAARGTRSPFDLSVSHSDQTCTWTLERLEDLRYLTYQVGGVVGSGTVVTFHDSTEFRRRQRRVASLARTAAGMATENSIQSVIGAMATEIQLSDGVAATQIITGSAARGRLRVMGSAGFDEVDKFFDMLMASHDRGARLVTFEAMTGLEQIVCIDRRARMLNDPAWQPIHTYIAQIDWDHFVATPLVVRGRAVGVLNVYIEPGVQVDPAMLDMFESMAEQAALAVDYATLIERDRITVRREERKRLARDLHDSVVQQIFSMSMQSRALSAFASRLDPVSRERIGAIADEISELTQAVQRDLRGVVLALQPSMAAELGLKAALELLAEGIGRRSRVAIVVEVSGSLGDGDEGFAEDVFQIVSESVHNAVKHASPTTIRIAMTLSHGRVVIEVVDDGVGIGSLDGRPGGYGLTSMRERVARWNGTLDIDSGPHRAGTSIRAVLPADLPENGEE